MNARNDLTLYDAYASRWWSGEERFLRLLHNLVPARMKHFDDVVESWEAKRVVDVGCGGGFMSEAMAKRGARVIGIDPAEEAVMAARAHATAEGLDVDYRVGRGEALPVDDASADVVVCVDVLEHIPDWRAALAEVARVLSPGGVFLFDTINRGALASLVIVRFAEDVLRVVPQGTHDPAMFIRPDELQGALAPLGFSCGRLVGLGPVGVNRCLDFVFGRLPTTSVMYMGHATLSGAQLP
jgi:2-polyprenyl-6-hydroxyphenyl methylase/3-demethylubiquinone-9 3-methyltransferase